ncbi:hypothetical protein AYO20_00307 [Fonsecaea nubica]|uniref:NADP-dependent oxidoreductase domain-containing protein n=1 Tax=Fonsecaea nubica TaxID=856822 RepID=A0A178DH97_9EURO|nr:hypothetical protein AYO20_00307 [Fonsecaea nubica]OAL40571.1 hypothetical protein AYO20_00307 [Fonsecaea nubica]
MSTGPALKILLGLANVGDAQRDPTVRYDTPEQVNEYLDAFYAHAGRELDTARNYSPHAPGTSEARLGTVEAGERFLIDTKVVSFMPGSHARHKILESIDSSIEALKQPKVNVEYLHVPDRATPFEETAEALNEAYEAGKFQHLGLSNFTADEVERFVNICDKRGFVKPSVYQGQYNPIVRSGEEVLSPTLRKHGMAFYAWSPAAAGMFAGNHKHIKPGDRFDTSHSMGQLYASGYLKEPILAAVDRVIELVAKHGITGHAAALRWTVYHSKLQADHGDGVIISASSVVQLNSNFDSIAQGPLPAEVSHALDQVYGQVAGNEFPYHY